MRSNTGQILYIPRIGQRANLQHPSMKGCVGWWPLTDGGGGITKDLVGSNDGTLDSGVTWETAELGTAAKFDGTNNAKITLGSEPVSGQTISISTWFYSESTNTSQAIYCSTPNAKNYLVYNGNSQSVGWDQYPPGGGGGGSGNSTALRGRWNHAVVTQDATTSKIYVNGELKTTFTAEVYSSTATTFYIGYRRPGQVMAGSIQNLRVWSRVLSSSEVLELYINPWSGLSMPSATRYFFVPTQIQQIFPPRMKLKTSINVGKGGRIVI